MKNGDFRTMCMWVRLHNERMFSKDYFGGSEQLGLDRRKTKVCKTHWQPTVVINMLEYSSGRGMRRKNQILDMFLRRNQGKEKKSKVASLVPVWRAMLIDDGGRRQHMLVCILQTREGLTVKPFFKRKKWENLIDFQQYDRLDSERSSGLKQSKC